MKWVEVKSSVISALGYEARRSRLGIEFHDRRQVYFYHGVPSPEFEAFLTAESKGRYLTLVFLPKNYRAPDHTQAADAQRETLQGSQALGVWLEFFKVLV